MPSLSCYGDPLRTHGIESQRPGPASGSGKQLKGVETGLCHGHWLFRLRGPWFASLHPRCTFHWRKGWGSWDQGADGEAECTGPGRGRRLWWYLPPQPVCVSLWVRNHGEKQSSVPIRGGPSYRGDLLPREEPCSKHQLPASLWSPLVSIGLT